MLTVLNHEEIQTRLTRHAGWSYENDQITKTYVTKTFQRAIAFVTIIGTLAELADHHPDITIRYNKVKIELSTHSAGGITENDFALAQKIEDAFIG